MVIARNELRIGTCTEYIKHYCEIEDGKSKNVLLGNQTRDLSRHIFWQATLLALFFRHFQCPVVVAE